MLTPRAQDFLRASVAAEPHQRMATLPVKKAIGGKKEVAPRAVKAQSNW
jgi:hypothetical protein